MSPTAFPAPAPPPGAICTIERGCGKRIQGGLYAEVGVQPRGKPIEDFFVDPPVPVDPGRLGLAAQGVRLLERRPGSGIYDVWDWIGQQHYRSPADFVEEARRYGVSRRLPANREIAEKLGPESLLILLHPRAHVEDPRPFTQAEGYGGCPCEKPEHHPATVGKICCCGVWWEDLDDGVPVGSDPRLLLRKMPWGAYHGRLQPEGVRPEYRLAVFARFPVSRLAVVKDPVGGEHQAVLDLLHQAGKAAALVDE